MSLYRYAVNLKAGLFGLGIIIVVSLLWYTQSLVAELESNERKLLDFYARLIAKVASEEQSGDMGFVFDAVIQQIQFPIVVTTNDGQAVSWRNVNMDSAGSDTEHQAYLAEIIRRMDRKREPIDVRYGELVISRIHYGDSAIVSRLRWLPYVEIAVAGLFILVGFAGFSMIRNSEKRSIWVGMAREMAHQLGTPVSSLMGWSQLLKDKAPDSLEVLDEVESDVRRLEQIADRFQKIGSLPVFETWDLHLLAESSAAYFRTRLPKASQSTITVTGESTRVRGAETLLQWALENLIKNALDACGDRQGVIEVKVNPGTDRRGKRVGVIEVWDNGAGINPRDRRNIFRPGFSTKRRGWGLGLSLTRRIVEDIHRGRIRLVSSQPGETVIRVTLPAGES